MRTPARDPRLPPPPQRAGGAAPPTAAAIAPEWEPGRARQVVLLAPDPARLSRVLLPLKGLLALPSYVLVVGLGLAVALTTPITLASVFFRGFYPDALGGLIRGFLQAQTRTYAYFPLLLTDDFPLDAQGDIRLAIREPARLSRSLAPVKLASMILTLTPLPQLLLGAVMTLCSLLLLPVVLILGRYPRRPYRWSLALLEMSMQVNAWMSGITDDLPTWGRSRRARLALGVLVAAPTALVIVFATGIVGRDDSWRVVQPDGHAFSAEFPGAPTVSDEALGVGGTLRSFERATPHIAISVSVVSLRSGEAGDIYAAMREALGASSLVITHEEDIAGTDPPGLELFYRVQDHNGWLRFFIARERLYVLNPNGPATARPPARPTASCRPSRPRG